jgi:hypothetical protein
MVVLALRSKSLLLICFHLSPFLLYLQSSRSAGAAQLLAQATSANGVKSDAEAYFCDLLQHIRLALSGLFSKLSLLFQVARYLSKKKKKKNRLHVFSISAAVPLLLSPLISTNMSCLFLLLLLRRSCVLLTPSNFPSLFLSFFFLLFSQKIMAPPETLAPTATTATVHCSSTCQNCILLCRRQIQQENKFLHL